MFRADVGYPEAIHMAEKSTGGSASDRRAVVDHPRLVAHPLPWRAETGETDRSVIWCYPVGMQADSGQPAQGAPRGGQGLRGVVSGLPVIRPECPVRLASHIVGKGHGRDAIGFIS
jgi:hypothetical protein